MAQTESGADTVPQGRQAEACVFKRQQSVNIAIQCSHVPREYHGAVLCNIHGLFPSLLDGAGV